MTNAAAAARPFGPGWLRPEVEVASSAAHDRIAFSHWELLLPGGFLAGHPSLQSVLSGQIPLSSLEPSPETEGLITLLDAQGCFAVFGDAPQCPAPEFRRRFDRLRSLWYSRYYAHPLWNRLRTGQASRKELLAWLIHNYHVSRSAGVLAARIASSSTSAALRQRFATDVIEEYWHCDAYYFVRHPKLAVADHDVKSCVPLAASRAFELHGLRVAESDWLGHLLIAYFQESTIHFMDDCVRFYREVERAYGIGGFFDSWIAHMRLDREHGHADTLAEFFEDSVELDSRAQEFALRDAWLAYRFLHDALDQICAEGTTEDALKPPLLHSVETHSPEAVREGAMLAVQAWPVSARSRAPHALAAHREALRSCLVAALLSCLSYARDHDDIVDLGHLYREAAREAGEHVSMHTIRLASRWAIAMDAQFNELRTQPLVFVTTLFALSTAWRCAGAGDLFGRRALELAERMLRRGAAQAPGVRVDILHTLAFLYLLVTDRESMARERYLP